MKISDPYILAFFLALGLSLSSPGGVYPEIVSPNTGDFGRRSLRVSQEGSSVEKLQSIFIPNAGLEESRLLLDEHFYATTQPFSTDQFHTFYSEKLTPSLRKWLEPSVADLHSFDYFGDALKALREAVSNMVHAGGGGHLAAYRFGRKENAADGIAFVLSDNGPGIDDPNVLLKRSIRAQESSRMMARGKGFLNIAHFPGRVVLRSNGREWEVEKKPSEPYPHFTWRRDSTVLSGTEIHFIIDDLPRWRKDQDPWSNSFSHAGSFVRHVPPATGLEELLANLQNVPFDTVTEQTERRSSASWLDQLP